MLYKNKTTPSINIFLNDSFFTFFNTPHTKNQTLYTEQVIVFKEQIYT